MFHSRDGLTRPAVRVGPWSLAILLAMGLVLLPILAVPVPPLTDYPNHLARDYFLAFSAQDAVMRRIFAADWAIIPNLAMDVIVPPMMHILPPFVAGRVAVAVAALLPATGAMALNLALFRRRSLWQAAACLFAYDALLLAGFINFHIGIGVALWGAAAWVALSRRRRVRGTALGVLFGFAAFFCHIFGFALFGLLIGCFELSQIRLGRTIGAKLLRLACVAIACIGPTALYFMTKLAASGSDVHWQGLRNKAWFLLLPFLGYSTALSCVLMAVVVAVVLLWLVRRHIRISALGWIVLPVLAAAYMLLPVQITADDYWVDARVPVILGFVATAVILPARLPWREAAFATAILGACLVVRTGLITTEWMWAQADIAAVRTVLAPVTPDSRLLAADTLTTDAMAYALPASRRLDATISRSYWHYGAFAFLDHDAYFADAFTKPSQQPMRALPPYADDASAGDPRLTTAELAAELAGQPAPGGIQDWPRRFDYLLVFNAQNLADPAALMADHLTLLRDDGFAALYAVRAQ